MIPPSVVQSGIKRVAARTATTMTSSSSSNILAKGLPMITNSSQNMYAPVGKWIFATAGMVVGMIHVGGLTRLTQSGLSMTTWSPLGSLPPMTRREWQDEFERYKQYPEWQQRQSMTMSEFQFIYAWEYGHRMLGRCVGLVFCLPWMYFTMRKKIPSGYQMRMVGLLAMGGSQGLVGWWMVKSGLGDDRRGDAREIRVRPVRLATHLTMAFATYGALLWTGWDLFGHGQNIQAITNQLLQKGKDAFRLTSSLRTNSIVLKSLTAITVISGALVAGNDAGRAYNTYPLMDGQWIPSEILDMEPWYRNLYENTATTQWNHRMLGGATAATAVYMAMTGLGNKAMLLTPQARNGLYAVAIVATGQFALGVTTLLTYVPIGLAAIHQLGSVALFTSSLYLAHSLRYARPALIRAAKPAAEAVTRAAPK